MIRIVIASNNYGILDRVVIENEFMRAHEINVYDNREANVGIPTRFNGFIANETKEESWIVFCHQDFAFLEDFTEKIESLDKGRIYGVVGVIQDRGKREIVGRIKAGKEAVDLGRIVEEEMRVDNIDCCCIVVHSSLFKTELKFDETLSFHQYAEELCINAKKNYDIETFIFPVKSEHRSWGKIDDEYKMSVSYINQKHDQKFYISTCNPGPRA